MILFWAIAALLIAAALLFVLPPLLRRSIEPSRTTAEPLNVAVYRDQQRELEADRRAGTLTDEQYERARLELERRLLDDVEAGNAMASARPSSSRISAMVIGLMVPLAAIALYFAVGSPRALAPAPLPKDTSKGVTAEQVETMVAKLAERMKQNPDDPQGWAMLGKAYAVMNRFDDAAAAYGKAVERVPDNPHLLADYADALAMKQGQSLAGEPEALVARALKIDPNHPKSLALAGTIAFEKKDYAGALRHWEGLAAQVPPDSDVGRNVQASIAEARALMGSKDGKNNAAGTGGGVSGTVTLAPALKDKVAPDDTVFIFARAVEGSRMPLAILRKKVSDLPAKFALDDSLAMSPATRLSGTQQVVIGARVSKSGNATPQPGDLQGFSKPVSNTDKGVSIVIDADVR